jgi:hypothetical protein
MRLILVFLLSLGLAACASASENAPPEQSPKSPDEAALPAGMHTAITDSHFVPPFEVSDLVRAPAISSSDWMVCIRSAQSDETRRIMYSAFFKDKYVSSRYSVYNDGCAKPQFHPFVDTVKTPAPSPTNAPAPVAKKHHHRGP